MPGGSGTGPMGMGPRTGRAAGYCAGSGTPGYANMAQGRGFGAGFGRARGFFSGRGGWRNWMRFGGSPVPYDAPPSYPSPDPEMEKRALREQVDALKAQMEYINSRLGELESRGAKE